MKQATTDKAIKSAQPEAKPYKLSAGQGLYLLVNPNGSKLWRFKYRYGGKEKKLSFGAYPDVSLRQANLLCAEARQQLAQEQDPRAIEKERKQERQAQQLTFRVVAERWYTGNTEKAKKPWSKNTARKVRVYLNSDLLPVLGNHPIADISRRQLVDLNARIEKRGAIDAARNVRNWLTSIFDVALNSGDIEANPAYRLKPSFYAKGATSKHYPFVSFAELPQLLADVNTSGSHLVVRHAIRLLVYTGVRTGELRFSTWPEFDLDAATWTIPAERMKMRRPHVVPLSSQAVALLREVQAINPDGYPFSLTGGKPFSDMTINKALKLAGYEGRQTGHGFRHLISTELNERGYNGDWIELQLAHKVSKNKIRATYNHAEYLDDRRRMMQAWADSIDAACAGANVVSIGSRKA